MYSSSAAYCTRYMYLNRYHKIYGDLRLRRYGGEIFSTYTTTPCTCGAGL